MDRYPFLPTEEDGRLHDPHLREHFLERVFATQAWLDFCKSQQGNGGKLDLAGLVAFHTRHKLSLMAHNQKQMRLLGELVAHAKGRDFDEVLDSYWGGFATAMKGRATARRHVNVMTHILGHFKKDISADEKAEALELIERFRDGEVPLVVPLTLLNHFVRKYQKEYLAGQAYLHPHPLDLMLRSQV
jgi:uncharacterized protein YbgA (DUF1722 family)